MKYLFDREGDTLTLILAPTHAPRKYSESEEVWPGIVVDFDSEGRPIAFDFADASKIVDTAALEEGRWIRVGGGALGKGEAIDGASLRLQREILGMTQQQLGEALGVAANTVARWERGELRIENARMLSLALAGLRGGSTKKAFVGTYMKVMKVEAAAAGKIVRSAKSPAKASLLTKKVARQAKTSSRTSKR